MGDDGYPASPCSPPYGYPLYYKRAEKIGVPQAGAVSFANAQHNVSTNLEDLQKRLRKKLGNDAAELNGDDLIEKANEERAKLLREWRQDYYDLERYGGTLVKLGNENFWAEEEKNLSLEEQKAFSEAQYVIDDLYELVDGIIALKNITENNTKLIRKIKDLGLDGIKNSKKVHEFIKGVAEEHLGKKFLVKIPKGCNLKYSEQISHVVDPSFQPLLPSNQDKHGHDIDEGPFGFKPQPINSDTTYTDSFAFTTKLQTLMQQNLKPVFIGSQPVGSVEVFSHYLDEDAKGKYTYGALKGNYNPIAEKWDFNYEPNTQGGFFDFALFDRNLSFTESASLDDSELPIGTQQQLLPKDLTNFVTDGRIKCFARYDHSEWLDFTAVSKNSFTQQKIVAGAMVPDVLEELDNVNPSKEESLDRVGDIIGGQELPPSVAFVACTIDDKFYMAPKTHVSRVDVYGRQTQFVPNILPPKSQRSKLKLQEIKPIFTLAADGGSDNTKVNNVDFRRVYDPNLDAQLIDTDKQNLDSDHVYAIITVPGRIKPTADSRYLDGIAYSQNPHKIKHAMTQDVVRGPAGFDSPPPAVIKANPVFAVTCEDLLPVLSTLSYAQKQQKIVLENAGKGGYNPVVVAQSQPSPVYPDIVALPLTSMERCYGPWMSSAIETDRIKFSDIGGKIEFVKDENIAPWNYAGYQLMNEAGKLQAEFSNSLLLFSERGGFSIPEAPTGVSLATALKSGGPLVTSISVDIGEGISTTIKMDLYTSSFGKLQKQKELAIAGISRERQKIIDRNNKAIRNGLGKASMGIDYLAPVREIGESLIRAADSSLDRIENNIKFSAKQNDFVSMDGLKTKNQTLIANTIDDNKRLEEEARLAAEHEAAKQRVTDTVVEWTEFLTIGYEKFSQFIGGKEVVSDGNKRAGTPLLPENTLDADDFDTPTGGGE